MSKPGYVREAIECPKITLNNVPRHIETKQSHCSENQLADIYMTQVFVEISFRTNSNLS